MNSINLIQKSFRFKVTLRLLGICFFGCATGFLIFDSPFWMAGIWTALITAGLFYETVRFVSQSERKLTAFLQSIKQNDFTVTFSENAKSNDYDLHQAFNQLNETFKSLRSEKESQHQLLQVIVEHAAVPLICFDESNEEVYLINNAAKHLFQLPFLQKIESLWRVERGLPEFLRRIKDGEKASLKLVSQGKVTFLSVTSRHLLFKEKNLKLIAMADVSSELAAKEAEAWQKLLRVLTHEISNSAIPLSTLSSYIHDLVTSAEADNRKLSIEERQDVLESLKAIDQRSKSLKEFVHNFNSLNQVPEPILNKTSIHELVTEVKHFFSKELEKENIQMIIDEMDHFQIYADKNLTMQALINLMKNAIESMDNMKNGKIIRVSAGREGHQFTNLYIADSGCGIPADVADKIFIPFFSTKKSGSGIGLSICQQIMQKQKGDISVRSLPGKGSVFSLSFASR
ncbi:MAG TPA: ATP-binding protein [Cyclobacteriaceae bacterium]|jgi:two-component system nitrogen regulation sensor histidine kinase NtrY|nr:GHKL domain-containing protein [Cytophagales bacterium]HRE67273.1 ATP-binding protein [Cyclobacteriaceae bacterium]HRF35507.1 ATP-binding protein [Cyclobacteriaceae bacterium]